MDFTLSADSRTNEKLLDAARNSDDAGNVEAPRVADNRYVRALKRLKDVFQDMPGGIEGIWG